MTLLLVDDEPLIRQGIRERVDMAALGIETVWEADSSEAALLVVKAHHPDMLLTDINMPGMDGLALAKTVKELSPATRIAVITGYDYFEYAVTALKTGVDDYVLKPVSRQDIQALLSKLANAVREEQRQREALAAVAQLSEDEEAVGNDAAAIRKVLDRELSNPEFTLAKLAQEVSLSQTYLSTRFRQLFGIPFQDWMLRARIERAKILLLSTNLKVYEIAAKVGFDDPNYFSTAFKKLANKTPNRFRDTGGGI